jgi:hypothetical protein
VQVAKELKQTYKRDLIIPMTVWREDYFRKIQQGLKNLDHEFYHFCLTAPEEILIKRLNQRTEKHDWALSMVHTCVEAFKSDNFQKHIDTTNNSPREIVHIILNDPRS